MILILMNNLGLAQLATSTSMLSDTRELRWSVLDLDSEITNTKETGKFLGAS